jgi:hypothetical protein
MVERCLSLSQCRLEAVSETVWRVAVGVWGLDTAPGPVRPVDSVILDKVGHHEHKDSTQ